jgi:hypothetical protein
MVSCKVVRQELERHESAQICVLGLVHDPHPATAEFLDDAAMRNRLAYERT